MQVKLVCLAIWWIMARMTKRYSHRHLFVLALLLLGALHVGSEKRESVLTFAQGSCASFESISSSSYRDRRR